MSKPELKTLVTEYVHGKIEKHNEIKQELISQILSSNSHSIYDETERVSHTDLNYRDQARPWLPLFFDNVRPYMDDFVRLFMHENWAIHHTWYFRYLKGEYSQWHVHPDCSWTNVYFLQLPDKKSRTTLLNASSGEEVIIADVEEGDIISFPSTVIHCSKPNMFDEDKIVIAFNSDIYDTQVHKTYPVETYKRTTIRDFNTEERKAAKEREERNRDNAE